MARNDTILLDGIIDDRVSNKSPSNDRGTVFEYLALEQILKEYDLSAEEINHGWVDGKFDGGIDGFYIFVNGHLLVDVTDFSWPKTGSELTVWIITCKHHDTYKQATLDSLIASITELFDFRTDTNDLNGRYSDKILSMRDDFILTYKKLSPRLSTFNVNYIYASRGDGADVGESIISRAEQIKSITLDSFGDCSANFNFIGSKELVSLYRQIPNFTLELPFLEVLSRGEKYVILSTLNDYYNFINNNGVLRRYLFDSNVRDFMGLNSVNEDIKDTLIDVNSPDFWLLNNGVTILATTASVIGKSINMEDIQIVNGLQTTESIFRYFNEGGGDVNNRTVLVKVIVSKDEILRDSVIRATNNQTAVQSASLHATDKIQRDIEEILIRSGFYYERRKNFYKNQGVSISEIMTPLYLASCYTCLMLKLPYKSSRMNSRILKEKDVYELIFSPKSSIKIWPKIAYVFKTVDETLKNARTERDGEGFLKRWRFIVAFISVARLLTTFNINESNINSIANDDFNSELILDTWRVVNEMNIININSSKRISMRNVFEILKKTADKYNISDLKVVERDSALTKYVNGSHYIKNKDVTELNEKLIREIKSKMPKQPWKPRVHVDIIEEIGCTGNQFFYVINKLISEGYYYRQVDGVLYDLENNVVAVDEDRVDRSTLMLIDK
ncbi:AIPR family protein [Lelliottia amnigena]|uniref:AIPR family protein n=1 Tax=Lelliottia amnigena TaxID=61646 RepID=UPI00301946E1